MSCNAECRCPERVANPTPYPIFLFQSAIALVLAIVLHFWCCLASRSWGCVWGSCLWRFYIYCAFLCCPPCKLSLT